MAHTGTLTHSSLHRTTLSQLGRSLLAGALAGQVAGLVMAAVVMAVFTLFLGKGPLFPVQVIGSFVYGDAALHGFHLGAFLTGLVLHQAGPALAWGLAYGGLARALELRGRGELLLLGAVVGLASQAIDVNLLMPVAMNALHGHDLWAENVPAFWSWAAHLVFGLSLACLPWLRARLDPDEGLAPGRPTGEA